jgi:hypothetical protein
MFEIALGTHSWNSLTLHQGKNGFVIKALRPFTPVRSRHDVDILRVNI